MMPHDDALGEAPVLSRDGAPLNWIAAVEVIGSARAYLDALDARRLTTSELSELRRHLRAYYATIGRAARYKT